MGDWVVVGGEVTLVQPLSGWWFEGMELRGFEAGGVTA